MQQLPHCARPEEAGVASQGILDYIAARQENGIQPHALWILRHGKVAARLCYAPYDDHTPHMLFSLSKSFCSAAAGFAVQEGLLTWETRVIDVLPDKFPENPSGWLRSITLHHLLTMSSGLKPESDEVGGEDWARAVLACGCDHEPGTRFHYNSHGTYLVSCMVQRVAGMTLRDYLVPRLFEPLGMMNADGSAPRWDACPAGVNAGGWGLWLSCAQLAPFGQCLLQRGMWDGKQVLPREWLDRATVWQIDSGNGDHSYVSDWNQGYGYQFWMCRGDAEPGFTPRYRGDGAFGQYIIVDEKRDMVVCCVSGEPELAKSLDLIYTHLLAAADRAPSDEAVQAALQERLTSLAYAWPEHDGSPLPVGEYWYQDRKLTVEPDRVLLPLDERQTFVFHAGRVVCCGDGTGCCGMKDGEMRLLLRIRNAPFTVDITCRFCADACEMTLCGVGQEPQTFRMTRK